MINCLPVETVDTNDTPNAIGCTLLTSSFQPVAFGASFLFLQLHLERHFFFLYRL